MAVLSDRRIRELCVGLTVPTAGPMIDPFTEGVEGDGIISYGLTSAGYDIRLGFDFLVYKNSLGEVINPKRMKDEEYVNRVFDRFHADRVGQEIIIPAGGYILGGTLERFVIPRNLKGRCVGKSTLARAGVIINVTPLEPEWEGFLTVEISNSSPCPAVVFAGEGVAQLEFEPIVGDVLLSYKDKKGKYQGQSPVTLSIVK